MSQSPKSGLSRRERQIMDLIYASQEATAAQVQQLLHDAPSYSAVRALLRILEDKGHLRHETVAGKFVYRPVRPKSQAARGALRGLVRTFFDNSASKTIAALLDVSDRKLSAAEIEEISSLIEKARQKGDKP